MSDVLDELRGFCHGKTETVYTRAVAEIERLREATRWIPVGERLPDVGADVILGDKYGGMVEFGMRGETHWINTDFRDGGIPIGSLVFSHWKLKPDPPK